jgi:ferritin-like metal-binding protein YciE
MAELSASKSKLIQYLNEAYATEKRLETALSAHIAMASQPRYKKRLKEHLSETKRHGREVKQRIKQLGGTAETVSAPGPDAIADAAGTVLSGAQRAVALAQGSLHALRGTGEDEKQLKNAKSEYASESEEIATYTAIETLAEILKDRDTQRLARAIRRDEERMRTFLEREIPRLTKAVAKTEIPAAERRGAARRTKAASTRTRAASKRTRTTSTRAKEDSTRTRTGSKRTGAGSTRTRAAST